MAANNFDFDGYNALIKKAPMGLKLHLGIQLIRDVVSGLEHFDNPLESELRPILSDLKAFHVMYKESAKKAAEKKGNPSERSASIDNSTVPTIGVSDMMAMMVEMQKQMVLMREAQYAQAQTAARSIKEIQDGVLHAEGDPQQKAA